MAQRLVHLLHSLEVGGLERVVLELARRARAAGLDQRILVFDAARRDPARDFDPGDIPVTFLPRRPGVDVRFAWRLGRHLRDERIDVVHAHDDTALVYAALARATLPRRKPRVVATYHAWPAHATNRARRAARWAAHRASDVSVVSDELGSRLTDAGWITAARTIWNGVDLAEFSPDGPRSGWRARLGIPADRVLVGHVARLTPVKRHDDLLAAARALDGHAPPLAFVLAGDGPERARLAAGAADLDDVHLVARIDDVASFLREVDIAVLCSAHEGAPRAVLEALASGCPLVATSVGGVPELAGDAARLVAPARPADLARALGELAASAETRARLSRAARARARSFTDERSFLAHRELWRGAPDGNANSV